LEVLLSQTQQSPATNMALAPCPQHQRYGVGIRVFRDRRLLRQIRAEILRNGMLTEEIAALENVSPPVLISLLEQRLAMEADSGAQLREFAASRAGFQVVAWRTTRKRASKLHILGADGVALCGTPPGAERAPVHAGPCSTCAAHAGSTSQQTARAA
jgi:hypothetical protein